MPAEQTPAACDSEVRRVKFQRKFSLQDARQDPSFSGYWGLPAILNLSRL